MSPGRGGRGRAARGRAKVRGYDRMDRVNELVREIVAERISTLADPRLEPVTITGADVTNDLSYATIYYAALAGDGEEQIARAAAGLESAAPVLRTAIGREARLRQTPELRFRFDPAIREGQRVEQILREIQRGDDS